LTGVGAISEYCQLETFRARCRHGDVVVMTTARFGRMRVGRCIDARSRSAALEKAMQSDSNLLGCYADVLDYADRMCSGKTSCDIAVPNRDLLSTRPCVSQLTMYFEAAYQCVSGEQNTDIILSLYIVLSSCQLIALGLLNVFVYQLNRCEVVKKTLYIAHREHAFWLRHFWALSQKNPKNLETSYVSMKIAKYTKIR